MLGRPGRPVDFRVLELLEPGFLRLLRLATSRGPRRRRLQRAQPGHRDEPVIFARRARAHVARSSLVLRDLLLFGLQTVPSKAPEHSAVRQRIPVEALTRLKLITPTALY